VYCHTQTNIREKDDALLRDQASRLPKKRVTLVLLSTLLMLFNMVTCDPYGFGQFESDPSFTSHPCATVLTKRPPSRSKHWSNLRPCLMKH
jgi:hypothetical protein